MTTVLSLCIAGIFSLWVWDLKREIDTLRRQSSASPEPPRNPPPAPASAPDARPGTTPIPIKTAVKALPNPPFKTPPRAPSQAAAGAPTKGTRVNRAGDVPTWTIE